MGSSKKTGGKKTIKDLTVKDSKKVVGGRKAGEEQHDYLKVTLSDVLVSGYSVSSGGA